MERVINLLEEIKSNLRSDLMFNNKFGLSVKEAAIYSGIGEKRLVELCNSGELAYKQVTTNKKIITKKALEEYLET